MMEFNFAEYQEHLKNAQSITDCDMVPVPKCAEHQNYIFISYSHRDYKKVYHDLAHMYQAGVRFWYDVELTAGKDWDDEVFRKINDPHCSGVVFYISDNFFQSQSIYKEVLTTLGKNKKLAGSDLEKNYFCVNLSAQSPDQMIDANFVQDSGFEEELNEEIALKDILKDAFRNKMTYISHGSRGYLDKLLVQIRRNFNVIDLTGDDASLIGDYTGEWLNGKRTGYGTCKYENGTIYEGEWKENKYNGKGRLTYPEGDQREYLEGTFVGHKANGHCVFKFRNGDCYTGNMTDGKITGHFTYTQKDGYTYVGDMVAGEKHGKGKLTYPESSEYAYYDGEWLNNTRCGNGIFAYKDGTSWEGTWKHDKAIDGFGTLKYPSGRTYFGNTKNGQCNGKGRLTYAPKEQWEYYEGAFVDGSISGVGVLKFRNGECYEGEFLGGKYHGKGKLTYEKASHVDFYEGDFIEGKKTEKGVMQFRNGAVYSGEWLEGDYSGYGEITEPDGSHYEGHWQKSKKHGHGKYTYNADSKFDYYEGQWLNSKRCGQGLLVYKNGDRWEGEWKNGERCTGRGDYELPKEKQHYNGEMKNGLLHGKGKLTYEKASHIDFYEGDFVEDKKTGKGTMVFRAGDFYEGEWANDEYNGQGKLVYNDKREEAYYEGGWLNSDKHGFGVMEFRNGSVYRGEWQDNKYHGKGKLTYEKASHVDFYEGDFIEGKKTGKGTMVFRAGDFYEGEWLEGKYHGKGKLTFKESASAVSYEGEFVESLYTGKGTMHYRNGSVYSGEWQNDKKHGQGILVYKDGSSWEGTWENGHEQDGFGTIQKANGDVYYGGVENGLYHGKGKLIYGKTSHIDFYEGDFVEGKKTGSGIMKFRSGESYEGEWADDNYHGYGVLQYKENQMLWEKYEGEWVNSKKSGHGVLTYTGGSYFDGQWENDLQNGPGILVRKGVFKSSTQKGVWTNGRYDWTSHKFFAWYYNALRQQQQYEEQERMCTGSDDAYQGEWKNGKRSGKGVQVFPDGSVYDGEWKGNQFHGLGSYTHNKNGSHYEGYWKNQLMNGSGRYSDSNGNVYEGFFKMDRAEGQGTFTDGQGNVLEGTFRKDRLFNGSITLSDGTTCAIKKGKVSDETVFDKLPEDTKAFLTKTKKEWYK